MKLIAYHGSQEIKDATVARMVGHIEADELVRGLGFENGRGCAVGCTLNKYEHKAFETELGIPEWVAHLNDTLHENTSDDVWPTLQLRFLRAVEPGMSFDGLDFKIKSFIQARNIERVQGLDISETLKAEVIKSIQTVKVLCDEFSEDDELWSAAESAAWSAAESAARSAESAAESAARSAESAAESAESAEWSAAWSAESAARSAESAAESAEYDAIAEEFIRLVEAV